MDNAPEEAPVAKEEKKGPTWRELFVDKFIDLLMVVLGIYIAFQIDNWKEAAGQRSLEKFYFQSILTDLDKDILEYKRHLADMRADQSLIQHYLSATNAKQPNDSLGYVAVNILSFETFIGNKNTYLTLLSSNGLSIIHDPHIHNHLTEYYNLYTSLERFDKVYTDVIYKVNDYFIPFVDYATFKLVNTTGLNNTESNNFLLLTNEELKQGMEDYKIIHEKALALEKEINAYLH